jgi:hypothetical protein
VLHSLALSDLASYLSPVYREANPETEEAYPCGVPSASEREKKSNIYTSTRGGEVEEARQLSLSLSLTHTHTHTQTPLSPPPP